MKLTLELKVTRPAPKKFGQRREEMSKKNVKNDITIADCQVHTPSPSLSAHLLGT
jgi:hypothetical protein